MDLSIWTLAVSLLAALFVGGAIGVALVRRVARRHLPVVPLYLHPGARLRPEEQRSVGLVGGAPHRHHFDKTNRCRCGLVGWPDGTGGMA